MEGRLRKEGRKEREEKKGSKGWRKAGWHLKNDI